jgi:hypothetical protein
VRRPSTSLAEAFLVGGVANFLGTHWPVGDDAALAFSTSLYRHCYPGDRSAHRSAMRVVRYKRAAPATGPTTFTTATRRSYWHRPHRTPSFLHPRHRGKRPRATPTVHRSRSTAHCLAAFVNRHKERERRHNGGMGTSENPVSVHPTRHHYHEDSYA